MPKKTILYCLLLFLLCANTGCAQTIKIATPPEVKVSATDSLVSFTGFIPGMFLKMEVDILDNIYLLTQGYQLKKIDAKGDSIGVFNDVKRYGNPSYIDVNNPFKVLVYYKNFSTAVILDRQLSPRNTINFRKQDIFSVKAITTSYDNNIWLFDEQDYKLKKINDEGRILLESTDMRQLVDSVPSPIQIIDSDDFVYLYDPTKGFYVFDHYGTLKNNLPFLNWRSVSAFKKKLYGFDDTTLYSYELESLDLKKYRLPPFLNEYENIKTMNGKVYMLTKTGVQVFNLKK